MMNTQSVQSTIKRGLFIVFEGLDRCGKTSQCEAVAAYLKQSASSEVLSMRFPDRTTSIGSMINSYLQGIQNHNDQAIHLLFSANRWEAQQQIEEVLNSGKTIVCDRYSYSGVAYTAAKGVDRQWCRQCDIGLIEPDLIVYLHAPKEVIRERAGFGGERYEKEEFQEKVRAEFKVLLESEPKVIQIDASGTKEEVFAEIVAKIPLTLFESPPLLAKLWV